MLGGILVDDLKFPSLDEKQTRDLRMALLTTVSKLGLNWNILAIIAYSSLITGEGAPPFSDLELYILTRFYDPFLIKKLESTFIRYNPPVTISIGQLNLSRFKKLKSIQVYDIKSGGKVIYGNPKILDSIRILPSQILKYESIRLLLNLGVMKLNVAMSKDILTHSNIFGLQKRKFIYNCAKANITVCAALLNFIGKYRYGLVNRAMFFRDNYKIDFTPLNEVNPELVENVVLSTHIKLNCDYKKIKDPISFWFKTRKNVEDALIFLLRRYFNSDSSDLIRLIILLEKLPHNFVNSLLYSFRFILEKRKIPPFRSFLIEPVVRVHIAGTFILWAVDSSRAINEKFVKCAYEKLREIYPLNKFTMFNSETWNTLKKICVTLNEKLPIPQLRLSRDYF